MPIPGSDRRRIDRRAAEVRRAFGIQVRRDRTDANVSQAKLSEAAEISRSHLCGIESGTSEASVRVMVALAEALGADLVLRMRPGTGPRIRDGIQARILEELIRIIHPRWRCFLEVPVHRPSRGVIDLVAHDPAIQTMLTTEVQSELRGFEQTIRWANLKRDALPSSDLWALAAHDGPPSVHGLMIVRSTRENRQVVDRFRLQFATHYPASPADAYQALTTPDAPWPGSALLWAMVDGDVAKILDRPPRGMSSTR